MGVKLTQVLSHIGDEKILLQFLDQSLLGFKETKNDLEVKFVTDKSNKPMINNKKMGIVIWLEKDLYQAAIDDLSKAEHGDQQE
ncbi:hypothetical protein [Acinetobacter ursingii]|uniref:hypothetical protein n=1 Tax=Acinetobacter ursingii TaxID=108980 RepID=UPI001250BFFF|nr:hypothetical protein [Acinetobacter ursingii]